MQTLLKNIPDRRVVATVIWLPVLPSDNRRWAVRRTKEFADDRVQYFWDGDRLTGRVWRSVLGLEGPLSWDTYFLYSHTARWAEVPSTPDFWMHQLRLEAKFQELLLKEPVFERETRRLLEQIP